MSQSAIDSFVRQLIRTRKLTLNEFCQILGYKSQTSLIRIMQGTANQKSMIAFADKLRSCPRLALNRQEMSLLDDLIELHEQGNDDFEAMLTLRKLLRGVPAMAYTPVSLSLVDGSFFSLIARYSAISLNRILILNCENVAVFHDLALLTSQHQVPIEHCSFFGSSFQHIVRTLHAYMPILYQPGYTGYSWIVPDAPGSAPRGLITTDLIVCEYLDAQSLPVIDVIVFHKRSEGRLITLPTSLDFIRHLLPPVETMTPIRLDTGVFGSDMKVYNQYCAALERDHAVYRIKPDIGAEQIPVHLLRRAVGDMAPPELFDSLEPLAQIFSERQQNILAKEDAQYHIMKKSALLRFAKTGKTSDHLWCCRAFTPAERSEILHFLRDQLLAKPTFHLYFLKDDDALLDNEVILYEGKGLSMIKAGTNYDLSQSHAEILITQPQFLEAYKRFYLNSTLRYHVESAQYSMEYLNKLIAMCENSESN